MPSVSVTITDNDGTTHSPAVYDLTRNPAANGRPALELGVLPQRDGSGDPKWFDSKFEGASITVSVDGTDEPVDTIIGVRDAGDLTHLTAEGGSELDQRVDVSFDGAIETHTAAQQVVEDNTSYGTDIPTPSTTVDEGVLVQDKSAGFASTDIEPPGDDSPIHVTSAGEVTLYQTLFFHDPSTTLSSDGDEISFAITTDYFIPADQVGIGVDTDIGSDHVGLEMRVDGLVVGEIKPGADVGSAPVWVNRVGADDPLAPGDHDVTIAVTADADAAGNATTDATPTGVALYDDRYTYSFDAALVDGPGLYPQQFAANVRFREPLVTRAVTGVGVRGYFQDNEAGQWYVSNGEVAYSPPDGSSGFEYDFTRRGAVIDLEIALQAYGSDASKTPQSGFKCETLTGYRLEAGLEDMPMVVDETFEGTVGDVLTDLADTLRGDFVWTYDTDGSGNPIVRFVRSGSRSTTDDSIEDYDVTKRWDGVLDEVTVNGGPTRVAGEGLRIQHSQAKALDRDRLVKDSESVYDPDGTTYERGTHYTIDYADGTITADPNPAGAAPIPDASVVRVDYEFQPQATLQRDGASTPIRSETVDLLALRSDRACRLAAKQLLDAVASPTYDASVQLRGNTTYSAVTDLVSGRLPASNLDTVDIEATPAGTTVRLEARQSLSGAVSAIEDRISSVARNSR